MNLFFWIIIVTNIQREKGNLAWPVGKIVASNGPVAVIAAVCHHPCTAPYTAASWSVHSGTFVVRVLRCRLTRWEGESSSKFLTCSIDVSRAVLVVPLPPPSPTTMATATAPSGYRGGGEYCGKNVFFRLRQRCFRGKPKELEKSMREFFFYQIAIISFDRLHSYLFSGNNYIL